MEIVLGLDNIIFISIMTARLPQEQRDLARTVGLSLAMVMRIALLLTISWVMGLTAPILTAFGHDVSGRDLILLGGGLFLIYKATMEIHERLEGSEHTSGTVGRTAAFGAIIIQIILLDMVFSLDSVITAVGMSNQLPIMVAAIVIAVGVMLFAAGALSDFVERHPTIKILALSFLLLIGVMLVVEGTGRHVDKGYIYFAMAFSVLVELLNMRMQPATRPVHLHQSYESEPGEVRQERE
ncbi:MAG: TerC family protein [Dehalococcoidia bacterium]|nr:TerC family protein [Dehalococcoidia bacterium]